MRKLFFAIIIIGLVIATIFALADFIWQGQDPGIGPAQFLGIQFGVVLIIMGIGFLTVSQSDEFSLRNLFTQIINAILEAPPTFWVVVTFLVLYITFFISPVFFEKLKIHYFVNYIPYDWVTRIGFDISWIMDDIQIWLLDRQSTYTLYAPLTTILFSPLILLGFPGYYKLIVMITILSFSFATLLIPILARYKENYALILLLFVAGLLSYGFQFELDRGQFNLIAFGLSMVAIYIFHFHQKHRFFSYLLFSLSLQLKLYPAIFIFMLIDNWHDWKNNISRVIRLGFLNFCLLFVLGYKPFIDFVQNITRIQLNFRSSRSEDLSIKGFVYNLTDDGLGLIEPSYLPQLAKLSGVIEIFFLSLFGFCLLAIIVNSYKRRQEGLDPYLLVVCTVGALIIPSMSFDYKLPMLIAPMSIMLSNLPSTGEKNKKLLLITLIIIMSTAFWSTFYPLSIKPYAISRNFPALITVLICTTIMRFMIPYTIVGRKEIISRDGSR